MITPPEAFLYGVASTLFVESAIQFYNQYRHQRQEREIKRMAAEIVAAREVKNVN